MLSYWKKKLDLERALVEAQARVDAADLTLRNIKTEHEITLKATVADAHAKEIYAKHEIELLKKRHTQEHELKVTELETLLKLKHEQQLAQIQLDSDRKVDQLKAEHLGVVSGLRTKQSEEMADFKAKLSQEFYEKIQLRDNQNTEFVMGAAMKFLDKPALPIVQRIETKNVTENNG